MIFLNDNRNSLSLQPNNQAEILVKFEKNTHNDNQSSIDKKN
jgi:hypothetical protein